MKHCVGLVFLRRWTLISLSFLLFSSLSSAQDIAIGTWRTHFSYQSAKHLAITPDKIFCASTNGLFSREIESGSFRLLSKIDNLSDVGVSAIAYQDNVLVIGYYTGYVDLVYPDKVVSISAIASSNLDGEKAINDIAFGDSRVFLATDLGVVVVDMDTGKIIENYVQIGTEGKAVSILEILNRQGVLFVRTNEGIQSGKIGENLLDFGKWKRYTATETYTNLTVLGENIYSISGSDLMKLGEAGWETTGVSTPAGGTQLFQSHNKLFTYANKAIYEFENGAFVKQADIASTSVNDIEMVNDKWVIADDQLGMVDAQGNQLSPTGPVTDIFSNLRIVANNLYGFHAPTPFAYDGTEQQSSFSIFSEGMWEKKSIPNFSNVSDVAVHNSNYYYASIGSGIYYESDNKILKNIPGSITLPDTVITSMVSQENNLWVSSFDNNDPIHILNQEGSWTSYGSGLLFESEFLTIDLSESGSGWLGGSSGAITVLDPESNKVKRINTSSGLPSSFTDIDISVEDNVWVGTNKGPAIFADATLALAGLRATLPSFENRPLLDGERINAVMTDGGNRIWFGTNKGLWVYDENTAEQVATFNQSNSPLPSDKIIQLVYHETSGEVFILTDRGLVSFRSSSSIATRSHTNVNIFPNPVRPDYQGLVGLSGLANNASIKVTDINGVLISDLQANGGTASWNLNDKQGKRVASGVYLFFSSSTDGEETYVGKIAVIR